jgi:hypothetical protein
MRRVLLAALAVALLGCPEERPGVEKQIPPQRVPPAMAIDPAPVGSQAQQQPPRQEQPQQQR